LLHIDRRVQKNRGACAEEYVQRARVARNDLIVFDVTAYPLFMQALQAIPAAERTGPLVVDDEGIPLRRRNYQELYRDVANAAGVPRTVWNMFARHGGVTEAHESGANLVDIGKHAQHTDINTGVHP